MSSKDCGNHHDDDDDDGGSDKSNKNLRRTVIVLAIIFWSVFITVLITLAILHPSKPNFILQDVTINAFNLSSSPYNLLTTNIQVTIYARNPNDQLGIYYDQLDVYAVYNDQQITLRTKIPATYQETNEANVWSPIIYGQSVPVAPENGMLLDQDESNGGVMLMIKVDGRFRWKTGTIVTGEYHINVNCPASIPFERTNTELVMGNSVKYQLGKKCSVST